MSPDGSGSDKLDYTYNESSTNNNFVFGSLSMGSDDPDKNAFPKNPAITSIDGISVQAGVVPSGESVAVNVDYSTHG